MDAETKLIEVPVKGSFMTEQSSFQYYGQKSFSVHLRYILIDYRD